MTYDPLTRPGWIVSTDEGGRPIVAPIPPGLTPDWQSLADKWPSPYGAGGEQQFSGSVLCPAGATTSVLKWAGPGGRPYAMRLGVTPDTQPQNAYAVGPQNQPTTAAPINLGSMFDDLIVAVLRWQVGSTRYEAELDLNRGSLALPVMATRAELLIRNGGIQLCGFAASICPLGAEHGGGVTEARRTNRQIVDTATTVPYVVPNFARRFWVGAPTGLNVDLTASDTKGSLTPLQFFDTGQFTTRYIHELPNGCATILVSHSGGNPETISLIFSLGLP